MGFTIPEGSAVVRTYVPRSERLTGAWAWSLMDEHGLNLGIGSPYPVTELLKGPIFAQVNSQDRTWTIRPAPDRVAKDSLLDVRAI